MDITWYDSQDQISYQLTVAAMPSYFILPYLPSCNEANVSKPSCVGSRYYPHSGGHIFASLEHGPHSKKCKHYQFADILTWLDKLQVEDITTWFHKKKKKKKDPVKLDELEVFHGN